MVQTNEYSMLSMLSSGTPTSPLGLRVQPLSLLLHRPEPTLEEVMFQAVGLKYANKRKDAKTQTLVKSEFSATSIRLRI